MQFRVLDRAGATNSSKGEAVRGALDNDELCNGRSRKRRSMTQFVDRARDAGRPVIAVTATARTPPSPATRTPPRRSSADDPDVRVWITETVSGFDMARSEQRAMRTDLETELREMRTA